MIRQAAAASMPAPASRRAGRAAGGRAGHAVEALGRQQIQVTGRYPVGGVGVHRRREEHIGGDPPGLILHRSCPGHETMVPAGA